MPLARLQRRGLGSHDHSLLSWPLCRCREQPEGTIQGALLIKPPQASAASHGESVGVRQIPFRRFPTSAPCSASSAEIFVDFLAGRDVGIEGVPDDGVRVFVTEVAKAIAFEPDFEAERQQCAE
jgi:hypothetical protein